jgi:tetratricopeptide (TPR) repeat protein
MTSRFRRRAFAWALLLSAASSRLLPAQEVSAREAERLLERAGEALTRLDRPEAEQLFRRAARSARTAGHAGLERRAWRGVSAALWRPILTGPQRGELLLAWRAEALAAQRDGDRRAEIAVAVEQLRFDLEDGGYDESWESRRRLVEEKALLAGDALLLNRARGLAAWTERSRTCALTNLERLQRHAADAGSLGDPLWQGHFEASAADWLGHFGESSAAVQTYREAAVHREQGGDLWRAAIAWINLAHALHDVGDLQGVREAVARARETAASGGWDFDRWAPEWLISLDIAEGRPDAAIDRCRLYEARQPGRGLFGEALVELDRDRPHRALELARRALRRVEQTRRSRGIASAWGVSEIELALAEAYVLSGLPSEALPIVERLSRLDLSFASRVKLLTLRAMVAEALEREDEALEHDLEAIEQLENLRSGAKGLALARFFSIRLDPLEDAIRLLIRRSDRLGSPAALYEALRLADRAKARALLDRLSSDAVPRGALGPAPPRHGVSPEQLLRPTHGAPEDCAANEKRLKSLRQTRLAAEAPRWPSAAELVRELGLGAERGLAEWFFGSRRGYLFVFVGGRITALELGPVEPIREAVRNHRALVQSDASAAAIRGSGEVLARRTGIDRLPKAVRRWTFVPDGSLSLAPLETLPAGEGFLGERAEIVYAYSVSTAMTLERRSRPEASGIPLLAVGAGRPQRGPELPYAEREARLVRRLLDPSAPVHLGRGATRRAVLEGLSLNPAIVVLAAEGRWGGSDPGRAGLELADGALFASEIVRRPFRSRLTILASCRSGDGRVFEGEGLHSISDAFLAAGSQSTLVSLWRVRDRQSFLFLENFYWRLREGHAPGEALRLSRREAIRKGLPPSVWGSFVLRGSPGRPLVLPGASPLALSGLR